MVFGFRLSKINIRDSVEEYRFEYPRFGAGDHGMWLRNMRDRWGWSDGWGETELGDGEIRVIWKKWVCWKDWARDGVKELEEEEDTSSRELYGGWDGERK